MNGMLGIDPAMVQQQVNQEGDNQYYKLAQLQPGRVGVATSGALANRGGNALLGAFGIQDPRVEKASRMQQAVKELQDSGIDASDPEQFYEALAKKFAEKGFMEEAMAVSEKLQAVRTKGEELKLNRFKVSEQRAIAEARLEAAKEAARAKAEGKDPEWYKKALESERTYLKEYGPKAVANWWKIMRDTRGDSEAALEAFDGITPTSQKKDKWGSEETTVVDGRTVRQQRNLETNEVKVLGGGGVTINNETDKAVNKVSQDRAIRNEKALETQYSAALQIQPYLTAYKEIIQKPLNTGTAADWRTAMLRLGSTLGLPGDKAKLNNDDLFDAVVIDLVLPKMQQLGGQDSNEELKRLLASVGDRKSDPVVLKKIVDLMSTEVSRTLARQNSYDTFLGNGGNPLEWNYQKGEPYKKQQGTTQSKTSGATDSQIQRYIAQVLNQTGRTINYDTAKKKVEDALAKRGK